MPQNQHGGASPGSHKPQTRNRRYSFFQQLNFALAGNNGQVRHIEKQSVLYNAHYSSNGSRQGVGVENFSASAVENEVSFVGYEFGARRGVPHGRANTQGRQFSGHQRRCHGNYFHRQRKFPEMRDDLAGIRHNDKFLRRAGDNFFSQQRTAAALGQLQSGRNFVGSINVDVDF